MTQTLAAKVPSSLKEEGSDTATSEGGAQGESSGGVDQSSLPTGEMTDEDEQARREERRIMRLMGLKG